MFIKIQTVNPIAPGPKIQTVTPQKLFITKLAEFGWKLWSLDFLEKRKLNSEP